MKSKKTYSERQIVKGCIKNDRFFQELLYRKHAPAMLNMCFRHCKDQHVALEIVNNGFLKVFQKLHTFSFSGSLEGWIRKIVFRALSDYYRKENRNIRFLSLDQRDKDHEESVLDKLYMEDILQLIDQLPDLSGKVFQLHAIEGYNHREIAQILNIKEGTSKWYLSEARKQLKNLVKLYHNNKYYAG